MDLDIKDSVIIFNSIFVLGLHLMVLKSYPVIRNTFWHALETIFGMLGIKPGLSVCKVNSYLPYYNCTHLNRL